MFWSGSGAFIRRHADTGDLSLAGCFVMTTASARAALTLLLAGYYRDLEMTH